MIHCVLFDLGGTLIDPQDPIGWSEVAKELGMEVEPDHFAHAFREMETELDGQGLPEFEEYWIRVLSRATGVPVPRFVAEEFIQRMDRRRLEPPLFSDVRYCLETLESDGLRMGLISNSRSEGSCRGHLDRLGIQRFFAVVVSSGTEGMRKPDPEIFRRGVERIGGKPSETLYVGDLPETDARGAERAGLIGLWLNRYGWGFGEDPPEVTSLTEVPGWVRRRNAAERSPS